MEESKKIKQNKILKQKKLSPSKLLRQTNNFPETTELEMKLTL